MPRDWRISPHSETVSTSRGWSAVAGLAARQHGVVGLEQLRRSGIAAATVRTWVARDRLVPMYTGVYAVGHAVLRPEGHRLAAVLACGDGAVLSHGSAAAHWGIRQSAAAVIDVTAPIRTGRGRAGLRIHCGARLRPDEMTVEDVVPCTTVASHAARSGGRPPRARTRRCHRDERAPRAAGPERRRDPARPTSTSTRRRAAAPGDLLSSTQSSFAPAARPRRASTACASTPAFRDRSSTGPCGQGERSYEADLHWPAARVILEVDSPYHDTTAARIRDRARDVDAPVSGVDHPSRPRRDSDGAADCGAPPARRRA